MEKILDTDGQAGTILHGPHRHQDTGHERGAIQRVVADGEGLALRSEEHLLMGHQAAQPHPVHMDTVDVGSASSGLLLCGGVGNRAQSGIGPGLGNLGGGGAGGAGRGVHLVGMMQLDDLGGLVEAPGDPFAEAIEMSISSP